ncbi:peptidoglycan DD-metalloendopeptidase family protein, partial [Propylenella binzhouense]
AGEPLPSEEPAGASALRADAPADVATDAAALGDGAAGWGETITEGQAELPAFKRTRIENTTSIAFVTPEVERFQPTEDVFVRVNHEQTLDSLLSENRIAAADAKAAGELLAALFGKDALQAGDVIAVRGSRPAAHAATLSLVQVSVYAGGSYLGTLARGPDGAFTSGADPWVEEDLFDFAGEGEASAPTRQYRLLDGIYSTAARNNVPTAVTGEAIMLLSRSHDLSRFADHADRLLLVYSDEPRDGTGGRVLYVAVHGSGRGIDCYVYRPKPGADFACMDEENDVVSQTVTNGMVVPVNGVMTSTFGPRKHPLLKTVRLHKGVDWAAPSGTPVYAAFDGKVAFAGQGADYGNVIRLGHSGGRETRYAHLDRFDPHVRVGGAVQAGDVIGYVGTTGLSTGPHLHFELYSGGQPIDPLQTAVASDGSAAEMLVNQIVRVESGGRHDAKNPLSSATGLGQFIQSTWLRMMRTYRPDLARSLSVPDQLALRLDPTLSREMVRNLAHEGEAYLRARGHQITAGRLYLSHFLGMEGAHLVLSSAADTPLLGLLGQDVIAANPFLAGKSVGYVTEWAERKMHGRRGAPVPAASTRRVVRASPEFERYKAAITEVVKSMS